jgi:hypothetical protein
MLKLFAFCLDSCIVNKGEKFVHDLGTWELLEGVQSGLSSFQKVWCWTGLLGRSNRPLGGQIPERQSNRPRQQSNRPG